MIDEEDVRANDAFWLWLGPRWFEWLAAVTMLAGVRWLAQETGDWLLETIHAMSLLVAFFYFTAVFCRAGGPLARWVRGRRLRLLVSIALGMGMAVLAYLLSNALIERLAAAAGGN